MSEIEPTPNYTFREGVDSDAVAARTMHAKSWRATYVSEADGVSEEWVQQHTDNWMTPDSLEYTKKHFSSVIHDPEQFYRLAELDNKIVGFVHVQNNDDGTKELEAIYTDPDTFGTGLGDQLMQFADEFIGEATVTLVVATYNQRAIRFYEKYGYVKIEGSEYIYSDGVPVMRMIRHGDDV